MVRTSTVSKSAALSRGKLVAIAAVSAVTGLVGNASVSQAALSSTGPIVTLAPVEGLTPGSGNAGITTNLVKPGDTFSIAIVGFNGTTSTASGAYLTTPTTFDPVFGTTNTYAGDALGGQTLTISSAETIGLTTTTDTFTISVPTNFAPTGTKIGTRYVDDLELDIGGYNAYGPGGNASSPAYDTIDYALAPSPVTSTGGILYGTSSTFALTPLVTAENSGLSYEAVEGVSSGSGATQANSIETLNVNTFTLTLSYPTVAVPEPTSLAAVGLAGAALLSRKRRPTV